MNNNIKTNIMVLATMIILSFLVNLFFPWWTAAIIVFLVAFYFIDAPRRGLIIGFFALFILWMLWALFLNSGANVSIAEKMGDLLGGRSSTTTFIITGLVGGLIGGLAGMSGSILKKNVIS